MNLFVKLLLSIVIAAVATAIITTQQLSSFIALGAVIAAATLLSALIAQAGSGYASDEDYDTEDDTEGDYAADEPQSDPNRPREQGEVKWFNMSKGFGFIVRENGEEIFVHFRSIRGDGSQRRSLSDGQNVSFVVTDSDKGPQAEDVEPL